MDLAKWLNNLRGVEYYMKKKSIYRRGAAFLAGFFILIAAANAGSSADQIINANYGTFSYEITSTNPYPLNLPHTLKELPATVDAPIKISSNVAWTL